MNYLSVCNRSIRLSFVFKQSFQYLSTESKNDDVEQRKRFAITKRMRLLGLQSNQARKALSIYDDYVYRQKKQPDLRMLGVAINCAMNAADLEKGREIHQFIERQFPHLKDNLMLKQQLKYFYLKCNDQQAADKLFQQTETSSSNQKSDN